MRLLAQAPLVTGPSRVGSMKLHTLAVVSAPQLEVPDRGHTGSVGAAALFAAVCLSDSSECDGPGTQGCSSCSNPFFVVRLCVQATPRMHHTLMSVWLMPLRQTRVSACCRLRTGARGCSVQCAVCSGQCAVCSGQWAERAATTTHKRQVSGSGSYLPWLCSLPRVSCHRHDGHDGSHTQRFS